MCEVWLKVVGYDGYEVSDLGRVRKLGVKVNLLGRDSDGRLYLRTRLNHGYERVSLCQDGDKFRAFYVHRLVMATFVGPIPKGHEVDHINHRRDDNRLCNLRYVTHRCNVIHSSGRHPHNNKGEFNGQSKLTQDEVDSIRILYSFDPKPRKIAAQFGIDRHTVQNICAGRAWKTEKTC